MREGWVIRKLGDICSSFSGYTPSGDLLHQVGAYPYFKVAEMNRPENLKVMSSTDAFIDNPTKVYRKGAIVFPKNGAAISTNKKRILGQDSVVDLNTGGFLANEKIISPIFLYYLMQHIDFKQYVRRGAVPTLDIKELKAKDCCIPPVQEQEKIVAELDCLTGIIEKKKQQLEELDKLAQSIFYDMFGDPITNEKGWEVRTLNDIALVKGRVGWKGYKKTDLRDSGPLVLGATHLADNGDLDLSSPVFISREKYEESPEIHVNQGDIILAQRGSIGKVGLVSYDIGEATINPCVLIVRPMRIMPSYFLHWFLNEHFNAELIAMNTGGVQPMITQKQVNALKVAFPPTDLQERFAKKIEAIEKQKELVKRSIVEAETLFNSRMDFWFNN